MQVGQYRVEGKINEYNANSLPFGAQVIIRSRINEETTWAGTVDYVDYENPVSGQNGYYGFGETATKYPFYVTVETSEGLMLGQHVYIELDNGQEEEKDGLWIPETYIVYEGDKTFVWAADDDEIEKREITVAETNYDLGQVLVSEGLTEEDWIAFPAEGIIEGSPVIKQDQQYQTEPLTGPGMPRVGAADLSGG
ncbi:MAG: efflux RND transporter periplasmic adaptor subunit [Lachnospiraceae bacterium]|nr:efflux RND transporter periplasmic adaptor subunit [Candidatus Minthocola equi]